MGKGGWTPDSGSDSSVDLCPDPLVAKKHLNIRLCKKGKGGVDPENSHRLPSSMIQMLCHSKKQLCQRTWIAVPINSTLAPGTRSQSIIESGTTRCTISTTALLTTVQI